MSRQMQPLEHSENVVGMEVARLSGGLELEHQHMVFHTEETQEDLKTEIGKLEKAAGVKIPIYPSSNTLKEFHKRLRLHFPTMLPTANDGDKPRVPSVDTDGQRNLGSYGENTRQDWLYTKILGIFNHVVKENCEALETKHSPVQCHTNYKLEKWEETDEQSKFTKRCTEGWYFARENYFITSVASRALWKGLLPIGAELVSSIQMSNPLGAFVLGKAQPLVSPQTIQEVEIMTRALTKTFPVTCDSLTMRNPEKADEYKTRPACHVHIGLVSDRGQQLPYSLNDVKKVGSFCWFAEPLFMYLVAPWRRRGRWSNNLCEGSFASNMAEVLQRHGRGFEDWKFIGLNEWEMPDKHLPYSSEKKASQIPLGPRHFYMDLDNPKYGIEAQMKKYIKHIPTAEQEAATKGPGGIFEVGVKTIDIDTQNDPDTDAADTIIQEGCKTGYENHIPSKENGFADFTLSKTDADGLRFIWAQKTKRLACHVLAKNMEVGRVGMAFREICDWKRDPSRRSHGKRTSHGTIEFRHSGSALDTERINLWLEFCSRAVEVCVRSNPEDFKKLLNDTCKRRNELHGLKSPDEGMGRQEYLELLVGRINLLQLQIEQAVVGGNKEEEKKLQGNKTEAMNEFHAQEEEPFEKTIEFLKLIGFDDSFCGKWKSLRNWAPQIAPGEAEIYGFDPKAYGT
ncbi:hypothetical protein MKZ38_006072 [Zalerion maritima]|uniref:Uncharacterized protein n=1 Tax=Zalerion maritima TaxID=339359 RepID=A0AAD5RXL1_9PEZI|nr:hypothetical protein MKZ38_006072 [Zalerion maritima]